jgi:hypothetical protein
MTTPLYLYWEFHDRGFEQALRMGDWKSVRHQIGGKLGLYNLKTDPAERKNVAAGHPKIIATMENYLASARSESADWVPTDKPAKN